MENYSVLYGRLGDAGLLLEGLQLITLLVLGLSYLRPVRETISGL